MNTRAQTSIGLAIGIVVLALAEACSTVPVTGRHELNIVSADQETQLGLTSFAQVKQQTPISQDPAANATVQRVGRRIAAVAGKDLPNAQWEFVVFQSQEANAFCLPGGKVGVYTGILPITQTDSGLATVLGHEIGHAVAHHGAERMSHQLALQEGEKFLGSMASTNSAIAPLALAALGLGSKVGIELPFDRKEESEADHIGLVYMARAGYDPRDAIAFWQRFAQFNQQQGGASVPTLLRDHPVDAVRIKQLQQWLPEAEAEFARSAAH
jgi:predicted Zn-dependent protease